ENGNEVESAETWARERRPEILEQFRTHVYGHVPEFDYETSYQLRSVDDRALGGLATRKEVTIQLTNEENGADVSIELLIYLPNGVDGPVPAFMGLNFYGNHTIHDDEEILMSNKWMRPNDSIGIRNNRATEQTRGVYKERWQVEEVLRRGYAVVTAYAGDIEPDEYKRLYEGVRALSYGQSAKPAADEWGTLAAWSWGLSRMMDYLETDEAIDHQKVAVLGHSRLGKAALWAGANDERFGIVISNNSGCGGAALSRRKLGETVGVINTSFPHWFCENHNRYNEREEDLPVDQHMLLALIAPRALYVASAVEDTWADPKGEFLSAVEATPAWKLYGLEGLPVTTWPEVDQPVSGTIGYHVRSGGHAVTAYDWDQYLEFADQHFSSGSGS
ncbi:MAG: acetylxylan esterase, partial [Bacteroidota bacterium]